MKEVTVKLEEINRLQSINTRQPSEPSITTQQIQLNKAALPILESIHALPHSEKENQSTQNLLFNNCCKTTAFLKKVLKTDLRWNIPIKRVPLLTLKKCNGLHLNLQ